jgi:hypothetical protein
MPVILATQGDQEDRSSKSAQASSSKDPISKKPITKRADGVAQGIDPEFKSQYHKKETKIKRKELRIRRDEIRRRTQN